MNTASNNKLSFKELIRSHQPLLDIAKNVAIHGQSTSLCSLMAGVRDEIVELYKSSETTEVERDLLDLLHQVCRTLHASAVLKTI